MVIICCIVAVFVLAGIGWTGYMAYKVAEIFYED
jgi:Tfp pilus assembly protein PilO